MKTFLRILCFALPILVLLTGLNAVVDPASIFHESVPEQMANSILAGNDTYVSSGNMDERATVAYRILNAKHRSKITAVGPSLIMCLSSDMVGSSSFTNYGESSANFYDTMTVIELLNEKDLLPEYMILCVDTMMFDREHFAYDQRWVQRASYAAAMMDRLKIDDTELRKVAPVGSTGKTDADSGFTADKLQQLFSFSYFQQSLKLLVKNGFVTKRIGIANPEYDGAFWHADGQHEYSEEYRNRTVEQAAASATAYVNKDMNKSITKNASLDRTCIDGFEKLIPYLNRNGTEVILFLTPFPPIVWEAINEDPQSWSIVLELQDYINDYAQRTHIRIIGSYDPYECGVDESDYYDNRHLRKESLAEHFDFRIADQE